MDEPRYVIGSDDQREQIARRFHEQYEDLAPLYGWTTQAASAVDWEDVPEHQRRLMVHVVGNLLAEGVIVIGPRGGGLR